MELLEREQFIAELNSLFKKAAEGSGNIVSVSGEAGIGKTSLVELFTQQMENNARVLWGACDDLFTPRPLAPLYDIASRLKSRIINQLDSGIPRPSIFSNLFEELLSKEPNIIVIEDVHWADESTLDLIKFLGRRINKTKSLLIITYRDDELTSINSLKISLSSIPSNYFRRIKLFPLSKEAVNKLAKSYGKTDEIIFNKTGGNPFLVTELLSNNQEGVPVTVRDLIHSKLIKLSPESQEVVELISVIPNRAEKWLLTNFVKDLSVVDEAIESAILKSDEDSVSFRHELGRMSVEESLSEAKRIKFNLAILKILLKQKNTDYFLARIIHHAAKAHDRDTTIKFAPLAAMQASKLGAHNQAAKHYLTALQFADHLSTEDHLNLLEGRAYESYLTGQIEEGVKACNKIEEILKVKPDLNREGKNIRMLSRLMWYAGQDAKGEEYLKKAITIFEKLPPGKQLAMAYSNLSQIYTCREETENAISWGEKAIELSKKINDYETEIHALNNMGTAKMFADDSSGENLLKKSLKLSLEYDFHDHISRAYDNIGSVNIYRRNLEEAYKYYSVGIEFCNDKDLDTHGLCMTAEMAKTKLYLGEWNDAIDTAYTILNRENVPVIDKIIPLFIIGIIRARRNDPGSLALLDEADFLAMNSGEIGKIVSVKSARAEIFWLQNKLEENFYDIEEIYSRVKESKNPWAIGEIAYWLWKGKSLNEIPEIIAEPFRLQIKGEWKTASEIWKKLNCSYEYGLALSEGDEAAMKKSIEVFNELGASASSQLIRQKMRKAGFKKIPKGPRLSTKQNIAGLTERQLEVLHQLATGLSNSEIAANLFISPKTVDHHISAIFSKLKIHTRTEAAALIHTNSMNKK